jgi:hypothetical protein
MVDGQRAKPLFSAVLDLPVQQRRTLGFVGMDEYQKGQKYPAMDLLAR